MLDFINMKKEDKNLFIFLENSGEIINVFNDFIIKNNLQSSAFVDHICYKCENSENYENIRKMFEQNSNFIYQAIISNRRIAVIKLWEPIKTILGDISTLELSDQKADNSQTEGFDHIEIVAKNYKEVGSYENFVNIFEKLKEEGKIEMKKSVRPHHTTYDITLGRYNLRLEREFLIEKIKDEEFK